ncbi:hypothetical protein CCR75_008609 [Bremia lactucae]|uniref:Uncharacterized protein n=1 Tax=Bremia lactucae TaxID=4779 RepID=A0A976FMF8_BRELC|nr:hypothetical protein CCR75_008609 [Bremia lactucae]
MQPNGEPLRITKKGTPTLHATARGVEMTIEIKVVYFPKDVNHILTSYGVLNKKGYKIDEVEGQRVIARKDGGVIAFDVDLQNNVLVVHASVV